MLCHLVCVTYSYFDISTPEYKYRLDTSCVNDTLLL